MLFLRSNTFLHQKDFLKFHFYFNFLKACLQLQHITHRKRMLKRFISIFFCYFCTFYEHFWNGVSKIYCQLDFQTLLKSNWKLNSNVKFIVFEIHCDALYCLCCCLLRLWVLINCEWIFRFYCFCFCCYFYCFIKSKNKNRKKKQKLSRKSMKNIQKKKNRKKKKIKSNSSLAMQWEK